MEFSNVEKTLAKCDIYSEAKRLQSEGARYVQILAVNKDDTIDLVYSFMIDGALTDYNVRDVEKSGHLSSISDLYFEAFVCENEISELFGLSFDGLVLDFKGNLYCPGSDAPMTVISPEELARREKEAKIKAALEAKKKKEEKESKKSEDTSSDTNVGEQEGGVSQ